MSMFLLVHGSWHGAWCWQNVLPLLRDAGHDAVAVDLPGHGSDTTDVEDVSFAGYVDRVVTAIDDAAEPVVLVGHSMGGHVVTQAAEHRADSVAAVVYVSAFLPDDGQALTDFDVGAYDSAVPDHLSVDEDRSVVTFDRDGAAGAFYHDCSARDVELATSLLRPEPAEPRTVAVTVSDRNYRTVPRVYIECTEDRALPVAFQRSMYDGVDCEEVYSLETGHAPFLSAPNELASTLLAATDVAD